MSEPARQRLARAQAEADAARVRLGETLDLIQDEMSPVNLANRAIDELRARGQSLADNALSTLFSRPILTALVASVAGYVLRNRPGLLGMAGRLLFGGRATRGRSGHSGQNKSKSARTKAQETL